MLRAAAVVVALSVLAAASGGVGAQARVRSRVPERRSWTPIWRRWWRTILSKAPMARGARFTENTGVLEVGEGLWVGASEAPTAFKIYVPDPATSQVGFFGVLRGVRSPGASWRSGCACRTARIVEAEHIVVRSLNEAGLKNLVRPRAAFAADVARAHRVPRAEMIRIADSYYDSLSKGIGALTPYADDCVRHENGMQTSTNRTPPPLPPASRRNRRPRSRPGPV